MRISPLVRHARLHLPSQTALFSDALNVASISVVSGGTTTITCASAHGLAVGQYAGVSISQARIPNPIVAAVVNADDTVTLTTQYDHDLTTTPDPSKYDPWNETVMLDGFDDGSVWDGTRQLVSVESRTQFTMMPGASIESITLEGGEVLLEHLERDLIGWKKVRSASSTTLTFPTPASIARSYTVTSPTVAWKHRIFGAADGEEIVRRVSDTSASASTLSMWIVPVPVKVSRSKSSGTDAISEIGPETDFRQLLIDGFEIIVVIPVSATVRGVAAVDLAHGEIFKSVLRTFLGLRLPAPEFAEKGEYVAMIEGHETGGQDQARYYHRYKFQVPTYIVNADAIAPYDWADIDPDDVDTMPDSLPPIGAPAARDVEIINPGLRHYGHDEPLTATIKLDEDAA